MLTLLFAVASRPDTVADFFPLTQGTTWTYEDSSSGAAQTYTDSVGNQQAIGGKPATPIVSVVDGQVDGSTFYRIEDGQVLLVAFEQNQPLEQPYPILKYGTGHDTWEHVGKTQWIGAPAPLSLKGATRRGKERDLFGQRRETLEVTLDATVGPETGFGVKSHQVCVYARGIGLVELKETVVMNKTKTARTRKLVSFKAGGG